jgi:lipoprotein-anchoring transpeptidase ErfK/SrfK
LFGIHIAFCLGAGNLETKQGDAMKALMLGKLVMAIVAAMVMAVQAMAQEATKQGPQQQVSVARETKHTIVVSLEDRKLALVANGQVKKVYPVAVGKPTTPSPVGSFTIERRIANPAYHHNGKTVPPGPRNPVGTRWMGLSIQGYGIHGTNEPNSIGKAASHGCIRMAKTDVQELYELVAVGDTVELVGKRNEETAQLFGEGQKPAAQVTAQPILTAEVTPNVAPTQPPSPLAPEVNGANLAVQILIALR